MSMSNRSFMIRRLIAVAILLFGLSPSGIVQGAALVADHRAVREFDAIPDLWIQAAKALTYHYAHTSHGSQIVAGLTALANWNEKYAFAVREDGGSAGLPPEETPPALRMYDGNPPETYIEPDDYWDGTSALDRTRAVVDTGLFDYSMWAWCGQLSYYGSSQVDAYLAALNTLDGEYSDTEFIYMTGHTDGGGATLTSNNQRIRDYSAANNKALFDFADIESWDLNGVYHADASDACSWCYDWCTDHPDSTDCVIRPSDDSECAHSHGLNCVIKAKAFWWMAARLAGWSGPGDSSAAFISGVMVPLLSD